MTRARGLKPCSEVISRCLLPKGMTRARGLKQTRIESIIDALPKGMTRARGLKRHGQCGRQRQERAERHDARARVETS